MDLIRPPEVEKLLYLLPDIKTATINLRRQLQTLLSDKDGVIEVCALKASNLNSVPASATGQYVDRTPKVAALHEKVTQNEATELRNDLLLLESIKDKLETSINALEPLSVMIIEKRYFKKENWLEIAMDLNSSTSNVQKRRREAIERLRKTSRITLGEFQICLKVLNG